METVVEIFDEIDTELAKAQRKYHAFNSNHEGYALILEEVEELWTLIKSRKEVTADAAMRKECIQIAAMAVRFVLDLCKYEDGFCGDGPF